MTIFSDNPYDRRMERLMITVPNFAPRGVGFRFTEAQVFITATAATSTEILTATMRQIRCPPFRKRFNEYIESEEKPMTYINEKHRAMFTVGDSYLADSADEIADALNRYTANDENDMAAYYNKDDGVSEKLTSAVWSVELHGDRLFGRIDCSLKEALTAEETEALRDWLTGQCSDGLGEGFEQQPIDTMDGELFVSFWNSGDDYAMMTEDEFEDHLQNTEMAIGGM